jgi:hypothetical protein
MINVSCNFGSFKVILLRSNANAQAARSRARRELAEHAGYATAIRANSALQQVMNRALVWGDFAGDLCGTCQIQSVQARSPCIPNYPAAKPLGPTRLLHV